MNIFERAFPTGTNWPAMALLAVLIAAVPAPRPAMAHSDEFPFLYVDSASGHDEGKCVDASKPCRTISYAQGQADKGDVIKLASGYYRYEASAPDEAQQLLSELIRVEGGYDLATNFESKEVENGTFLTGVDRSYAVELAARGIIWLNQVDFQNRDIVLAQVAPSVARDRYVAATGNDTGDCTDPNNPCQTVIYALSRAQEGDQIRVGGGVFTLNAGQIEQARRRNIDVVGGFSRATDFRARVLGGTQRSQVQSFVVGPSFREREQLSARGFVLLQDPKGRAIGRRIQAQSATTTLRPGAPCTDGTASGHPCNGIDLLSQMPLGLFSSRPAAANDIWGFVDLNDNKEYVIIGLENGTAVVDVSDPSAPREVATIPGASTSWRDVKVFQRQDTATGRWQAYAYVTADAVNQGLQVIDLTQLPDQAELAVTLDVFASAHNVYISNVDYDTGVAQAGTKAFLYILGSNLQNGPSRGDFRVFELDDPLAPTLIPTAIGEGYSHDATTLTVTGAQAAGCASNHDPCEILIDFNEDTVDIWDVTDKSQPSKRGFMTYPRATYVHSGWWSADKKFIFVQDELDERDHELNTTLRVVDITNLEDPKLVKTWTGPTEAIDHNGFTKGNEYYMSNYRRGLTILDVTDPINPSEARFFDTFTAIKCDCSRFNGAWGTYPYLRSGTIAVSDIEGGLFLLRK